MYSIEFAEKLDKKMAEETFLEKISMAESEEQLKGIFSEEGFEIQDSDLANILEHLQKYKTEEELSEEMLDDVNGGFISLVAYGAFVGAAALTTYVVAKVGIYIVKKKQEKMCESK